MGAGGVEGRIANRVDMAPGDETASKAVALARILGSDATSSDTSSAEGRKAEGSGFSGSGSFWGSST